MGDVSDAPLTPLSFLIRSAEVWSARPAVADRTGIATYADHFDRVRRACGALVEQFDLKSGDRVATLLPNVGAMLEAHYAVPGAGGVLVPMNTRLAAADYSYILDHSGARVLIASEASSAVLQSALASLGASAPPVVWVGGGGGGNQWEELVASATGRDLTRPSDERDLISINYTSGTTGRPKGVMTSHRGAYLHTMGVLAEAGLSQRSSYLWTLPMFHCNGWAYTWAVTASGATHVTLERVEAPAVWAALRSGITHMCAAPTVVTMLLDAADAAPCPSAVKLFVGGSPPSPDLLGRAAELNIEVTHLYGLTETYGPLAVCAWDPGWDHLPVADQARLRARQGVATVVTEPLRVVDEKMKDVPWDGTTLGEVVMRGNNVMIGYYRDPEATSQAFRGGWFHSGDLAVMHPDGRIEIRDRLKDMVVSGGENISTVEVEQALAGHPAVGEVAVIGAPDPLWGEVPIAFIVSRVGRAADAEDIRAFAARSLARFKIPKRIEFIPELPKTGTGKIQKFALRQLASEQAGLGMPVPPCGNA